MPEKHGFFLTGFTWIAIISGYLLVGENWNHQGQEGRLGSYSEVQNDKKDEAFKSPASSGPESRELD